MGDKFEHDEYDLPRTTATHVRMLLVAISMGDRDCKKTAHLMLQGCLERLLRSETVRDPNFDNEYLPYQLHIKEYFFDFPFVITIQGVATFAKRKDFADNSHFAPIWKQLTLTDDMKMLKQASISIDNWSTYRGEEPIISIPDYNYENRAGWRYQYELHYEPKLH